MNTSIKQSFNRDTKNSIVQADESSSSFSSSAVLPVVQKKDDPVRLVEPTHSMAAATDYTIATIESNSLSEYIVNYCHSFRNLAPAREPQTDTEMSPPNWTETESSISSKNIALQAEDSFSGFSVPPENLLQEAHQRLLSIHEMDEMQHHIQQRTGIEINGKRFELETLPEDTPLFYQFYCLHKDKEVVIDDKSLSIFRKNCDIEKFRPVVILMNKELINQKLAAQIRQLKEEYENVHIVDVSLLLGYENHVHGIEITQKENSDGKFVVEVDGTRCTLPNFFSEAERHKKWEHTVGCNILDIFQFLAMYHCDKVCALAGVETNSQGCIKIDFDMELTKPIGILKCLNGLSTLVIDKFMREPWRGNELTHYLRLENGLVAVARPKHPVMARSLHPSPGSMYWKYINAVRTSLNLPYPRPIFDVKTVTPTEDGIGLLRMLCHVACKKDVADSIEAGQQLTIKFDKNTSWKQLISFPLKNIKADQSRVWGTSSSWW